MKMKTFLIYLLLFLCGTNVFAQNNINNLTGNAKHNIVDALAQTTLPINAKKLNNQIYKVILDYLSLNRSSNFTERKLICANSSAVSSSGGDRVKSSKNNNDRSFLDNISMLDIFLVFFILVIAVIMWLLYRNYLILKYDFEEWDKNKMSNKEKKELKDKLGELEKMKLELHELNLKLKNQNTITRKEPHKTEDKQSLNISEREIPAHDIITIYAQPKMGQLVESRQNTNFYYKLSFKKDSQESEFYMTENAELMERAIKNKETLIKGMCNPKNSSLNAKSIKTITPGRAQKIDNGTWKIIRPAEIQYIS